MSLGAGHGSSSHPHYCSMSHQAIATALHVDARLKMRREQREEGELLRSTVEVMKSCCGSDEELQTKRMTCGHMWTRCFPFVIFFFLFGNFCLFVWFWNFQQMVFADDLSLRRLQPRVFWICRTPQFAFRKHSNCHMINMKLENPSVMEVCFIYCL